MKGSLKTHLPWWLWERAEDSQGRSEGSQPFPRGSLPARPPRLFLSPPSRALLTKPPALLWLAPIPASPRAGAASAPLPIPSLQGPGVGRAAVGAGFWGLGVPCSCVTWGLAPLPRDSPPQPSCRPRVGPGPAHVLRARTLGSVTWPVLPPSLPLTWGLGSGQKVSAALAPPPRAALCSALAFPSETLVTLAWLSQRHRTQARGPSG